MEEFYRKLSFRISKTITRAYSTSFSTATAFLKNDARDAIYAIYGFVRFADEIVDTFHEYDKQYLLDKFESDYHEALKTGLSLNPVLHAFQHVVRKYIKISAADAIFLFCGDTNTQCCPSHTISQVYREHKSSDNYLRVYYTGMQTFG